MDATLLLASFAKVSDGMVDIMQGGFTEIGPGPVSFCVAGTVMCQWHETNQEHELKLELLDADGQAFPHPENGEPVQLTKVFEVGRPPGVKPGVSMTLPLAEPFGAFELEPGEQYEIKLTLDGDTRDDWRLPFTIRKAPPPQQLAA